MRGEFGAGISALWMASVEPSSMRRVRRVKTLWTRKVTMRAFMKRKMARPRRMVAVACSSSANQEVEHVEGCCDGIRMAEATVYGRGRSLESFITLCSSGKSKVWGN